MSENVTYPAEYLLSLVSIISLIFLIEKIVKLFIFLGGAIDDFSKDVAKVPYVATVELSGTNGDGYVTKLI